MRRHPPIHALILIFFLLNVPVQQSSSVTLAKPMRLVRRRRERSWSRFASRRRLVVDVRFRFRLGRDSKPLSFFVCQWTINELFDGVRRVVVGKRLCSFIKCER
jgi:hypothetical protein